MIPGWTIPTAVFLATAAVIVNLVALLIWR